MPALQYPNPNKPFQLFTDTSKHSYSGILHQKKEGQLNAGESELIPIAYFSGTFNKMHKLWNTAQKECYAVYNHIINQSINWFKNSLPISQVQAVHYTAITNH